MLYNEVLRMSCDSLNTVLKVKHGMAVWVQNSYKWIGCLSSSSSGHMGAEAHCYCPALQEKIVLPIPSAGKAPNSEFAEVWSLLNVCCS